MFKTGHRILAFSSFLISFVIYLMTMAPTTSFWDCGEFIATSYIMGVPHPPGAPLFLLLGNVFSSFPFFNDIGARVNLISPIFSAFSVLFLYLIIVYLISEFKGKSDSLSNFIIINISAFIGAITFAISDSHWFNAVESEVYSLSTFFTAIVLWMILKWSVKSNDKWNVRYLLLISYMLGLATGVHLLNLLALPFIGLIIFFKKYEFNFFNFFFVMFITLACFLIIYIGIILGLPDIVSKLNSISIFIIFCLLIISSIITLHFYNYHIRISNFAKILSISSILILSFLMFNKMFIKSVGDIEQDYINQINQIEETYILYLNTIDLEKINESNIDYTFIDQLKEERTQVVKQKNLFNKKKDDLSFFGVLFWQTTSTILGMFVLFLLLFALGYFIFWEKESEYIYPIKIFFSCLFLIIIGYSTYASIFIRSSQHPRINENNPDNLDRALAYINRDQYGAVTSFNPTSAIQNSPGHWKRWTKDKSNPSFQEKARFIWNYQIKEMYLRYFAWQFIGRSDKNEKPWLIEDLDGELIGNRKLDGIDWFRYGLPLAFIFGVLGLIFHFSQDWKRALAVLSVFLATGIMIILYLNQYDPQPRERDYSYVGSFFTFSIWIGLGIAMIQEKIRKFFEESQIASFISISVACFIFMLMPVKMIYADYKEHDRSKIFVAWDYGYNLLNSCEPNAVLFTNGDNDTFPLWYLQEVENIRKDVKVVNLSLLNTPWYIEQLMNIEPKLDFKFSNELLSEDIYSIESDYLTSTIEGYDICGDEYKGEVPWESLNCELELNNNIILNFEIPSYKKQVLRIQDYMILQILKDEGLNRPIYFAATVSENNQIGLKEYLLMEGMTYRVLFNNSNNQDMLRINYSKMKQNLTQSALIDTIKTADDYVEHINLGYGIYKYTNLNDKDIHFSDNIKRLVQNYRIAYLRMAQEKLKNKEFEELKELNANMLSYFPNDILPIDPWLGFEFIDKIYKPLNDTLNQKNMINNLVKNNFDITVQLIGVLRSLELGHYNLTTNLLNKYILNDSVSMQNKMALFYEIIDRSGYHSCVDVLIDEIIDFCLVGDIEQNEIYSVLGRLIQIDYSSGINLIAQKFLIDNYESKLSVNAQKDIGDILVRYMEPQLFIDFCKSTFENHRIEGLMYSLINLYLLNDYDNEALDEIEKWLKIDKNNQRMINKRNKILEKMSSASSK